MQATNRHHNGRAARSEQAQRPRAIALVIHALDGTISVKDNDGHWHRHLEQIPQHWFLDLSPKERARITKAEIYAGRPLVEDSRLIVVLNRRPKKRRVSTALAQSNEPISQLGKPFQAEFSFDGQNGGNHD